MDIKIFQKKLHGRINYFMFQNTKMATIVIPRLFDNINLKEYINSDDSPSEYISLKMVSHLFENVTKNSFPDAFSSYKKKFDRFKKTNTLFIENFNTNDHKSFYNFFSSLDGFNDIRIVNNYNKKLCFIIFIDISYANDALMKYLSSSLNKYNITFSKEITRNLI